MTEPERSVRTAKERRLAALEKLEGDADVWVATASRDGQPHLVPLSLDWDGERVLVATPAHAVTARNATETATARLALGTSRDVVIIDADVDILALDQVVTPLADHYRDRTGWDPRETPGRWVLLAMSPRRAQVWRDLEENVTGRIVMEAGAWIG